MHSGTVALAIESVTNFVRRGLDVGSSFIIFLIRAGKLRLKCGDVAWGLGMLSHCWRAMAFQVLYPQTVFWKVSCITQPRQRFCVGSPLDSGPRHESWSAQSWNGLPQRLPTVAPVLPRNLYHLSSQLCAIHRSYGKEGYTCLGN